MSQIERDYWRDREKAHSDNEDVKDQLNSYKVFQNQNKSTSLAKIFFKVCFFIFSTLILILAMRSSDRNNFFYITDKSCEIIELQKDMNGDGNFTYKDIGPISLNLFQKPVKIIFSEKKLRSVFDFFEIKNSDCTTFFSLVVCELIWLLLLSIGLCLYYLIVFAGKILIRSILLYLFKISDQTKTSKLILIITDPKISIDLHFNLLLYFVVGLGIVFFLKTHYELFHNKIRQTNNPTVLPEIIIKNKN